MYKDREKRVKTEDEDKLETLLFKLHGNGLKLSPVLNCFQYHYQCYYWHSFLSATASSSLS